MNDSWPDLPSQGFIVGRPATLEDAQRGDAVFHTNGTGGDAATVAIPQYAYWSESPGEKLAVILVQAEHSPDGPILVGLRDLNGNDILATMSELELLGTKKPNL
ncbi:hypothetical protein J2W40_001380 [Sphingobium xenophagum]|uniref:Uncharacterized protein n=1 Tax=Sphingobium xenophagum TaxID=121428 RepID=A0ABU1WZ08_SPHXE|nr:hypothetical protein [Sphingobium xenophagum]MDR7154568.1 hypothetical protein [Sphingobium xenophagum]